jgi:hypothetical protein
VYCLPDATTCVDGVCYDGGGCAAGRLVLNNDETELDVTAAINRVAPLGTYSAVPNSFPLEFTGQGVTLSLAPRLERPPPAPTNLGFICLNGGGCTLLVRH